MSPYYRLFVRATGSILMIDEVFASARGCPTLDPVVCGARNGVCGSRRGDDGRRTRLLPHDEEQLRADGNACFARLLQEKTGNFTGHLS